jgi:membrane-associated phospholipid phosphatase
MFSGMKPSRFNMKEFLKHNWLFYSLYLFVLLIVSYYLLTIDKQNLHLNINTMVGSPYLDSFYKYGTHIGDGLFATAVGILIMTFNIRKGLFILVSYALAGGTASLLKKFVFNYDRPYAWFDYYHKEIKVKIVEGVTMAGEHSFPSGHATTAFALFTALALITKNKLMKALFLIIAVNAAFSRTYLSQHWLVDIYVGSMIGVVFTTILYFIFMKEGKFQKFDRPLLSKPE